MKTYTNKIKKSFFLFICFNLIAFTGCKKGWLEEKPNKALTVPITLNDFQGLLDNFGTMNLMYPVLMEIASDGHFVSNEVIEAAANTYLIDAYTWSKTVPALNISDWNGSYQTILVDNVVLEGINKITPANENEQMIWNNIKGQALFHRARMFFELAQVYSPAYDPRTADHDLGIVLKLSSDITARSVRSSVRETYAQILQDLNLAKDLLPTRPLYLTRSSASAVNALLSRVYLSMNDYNNAFTSSDNCLKQYSSLLDYNNVLMDASFIGLYNKEVILHTSYSPSFYSTYYNFIDKSLFDLYSDSDLRKSRFFVLNSDMTITFKGVYDNKTEVYFNGLATDEIYLTRAECHARAGRTIEAMKDLNDLLIKRWDKNVPFVNVVANSANEALIIILLERKKELIFRGTRWMDLRRLNKDPKYAITLKRSVLGIEYILEPNSYKYTFPIPDDIIQQTGMKQNPGWP